MYDDLPLLQEIGPRFGSTYMVYKRFLMTAHLVLEVGNENKSQPAHLALGSLYTEITESAQLKHYAFHAIITAFETAVHVRKKIESDTEAKMHRMIPMLECIQQQLLSRSDECIHKLGQDLCLYSVREQQRIETRPIWVAGSLLHSQVRSLEFVRDTIRDLDLKERIASLLRKMLSSLRQQNSPTGNIESEYHSLRRCHTEMARYWVILLRKYVRPSTSWTRNS